MNTLISLLIRFSLKHRLFILGVTVALIASGIMAFRDTIIDVFPDVTNTQVTIITQWPGRSAEELEKFVTIPIEAAVNGVPDKVALRSTTLFGLSVVKIIFDDHVTDFEARQMVANLLASAQMPDGVEPEIQPPYGPTGEIYRYTLRSSTKSVRELKTIQDWIIERRLRAVNGVADIVSFGGEVKTYEISVNPDLLSKYNLTALELYSAVTKSNINVGGDVIERNNQAYVVRGIGLLTSIADIENVIVSYHNGVPILVRNVATVMESSLPRLGHVGRNDEPDVVQGIVVMRKGEDPSAVIARLVERIDDINTNVLPDDVAIVPFYSRQRLLDYCIDTVSHNIIEGIVLVTLVVLLFMADVRATITVAVVIPLSLLFAFVCLRLLGMSANLLSIGAIDFGIIIDGAVVMVEGIFVALDRKAHDIGMGAFNQRAKRSLIARVGTDMGRSIFFAKVIIIVCLLPLFAFTKVEGKLFTPLAYTLSFALAGALLLSLTLVPVLISFFFDKNVRERHNPLVEWIRRSVLWLFDIVARHRTAAIASTAAALSAGIIGFITIGTEFLPQLNEGAMYVRANLPLSISLNEAVRLTEAMRSTMATVPEVNGILSQTGRPNDGTDPTGFYNVEFHVDLKPERDWRAGITREGLVDDMKQLLSKFPGIAFNFSQPVMDNVEEAVSGVKGSIAVKLFGDSLQQIETYAEQIEQILDSVPGIEDLGIIRNIGQPELRINLSDAQMSSYGVTHADANAVIEMAIGGKVTSHFYEGERRFGIIIRYDAERRSTIGEIAELRVPTVHGTTVPLKEIATIREVTGPLLIFRDASARFIAVKFSIRGRDMGSTIADAQQRVNAAVSLPRGLRLVWTGDFENQQRAQATLSWAIPVSLVAIVLILLSTARHARDAFLIMMNVPFALIGGVAGLFITGTNFSISAGIGFIALGGICILNGVLLVSAFHSNLAVKGVSLADAIRTGVEGRIRPIVMTACMGALGLLPAAMSTGIGSDAQRPLAIVVVSGFITATVLSLLIFPQLFYVAYRKRGRVA